MTSYSGRVHELVNRFENGQDPYTPEERAVRDKWLRVAKEVVRDDPAEEAKRLTDLELLRQQDKYDARVLQVFLRYRDKWALQRAWHEAQAKACRADDPDQARECDEEAEFLKHIVRAVDWALKMSRGVVDLELAQGPAVPETPEF